MTPLTPADITAYALLITAVGTSIAGIITAARTNRKVDEIKSDLATAVTVSGEKMGEIHEQAKVIERHVNGASTATAEKIASLEREIVSMREMIANQRKEAALLAQAAALKDTKPEGTR